MLTGFARFFKSLTLSRAGCQAGAASLMLLAGAGSVHDATASGQTRTLSFHHTHSGEDLTVTFKRNGRYDEAALKELNHYLRDWRSQEQTTMDRHLFDILWEVYRDVGATRPIQIISAYRSPSTNAMLRRRSAHSGVARSSQHMLGHAMDFFIPGVPLEQIRFAGLRLQRGGVGFYPTSGSPFVHLDTGNVRHWPRMSHQQLVRLFPDGRTVHIPSDGIPLKGYQLARADIEQRGNGDSAFTFEKPKSLLARLFTPHTHDDDDDGVVGEAPASSAVAPAALMASAAPRDPVPMPRAKPATAASYQVASADSIVPPPARPAKAEATTTGTARPPQTPADIINARGFWDDMPSKPIQATPAQVAAVSARKALTKAAHVQPSSNIADAFDALAYATASSSDRAQQDVESTASIPRRVRSTTVGYSRTVTGDVSTVAKGHQGGHGRVTIATRMTRAEKNHDIWMRAMILAPSASTAMSATIYGDPDMRAMRVYFVKPKTSVAMAFSDDPASLPCDRFTGAAVANLPTMTFYTASLR